VAAPTLTSNTGSTWNDLSTTSEVTGTLTWNSGDQVLVIGVTEDQGQTFATPTATGLTFTALGSAINVASTCWIHAWQATAGSSGSSAVTATLVGTSNAGRGIHAFAWGGCTGFVRTNLGTQTATQVVSVTRTQANSAMVFWSGDWSASGTAGLGWTPAGQTQIQAATNADYSSFAAYWGDQGSTGTTNYGTTGLAGTKYSIAAVEVLGTVGAASVPWATRPQPRTADPGESYWMQARRLSLGPLAAANPLASPLLSALRVTQLGATHVRPGWSRQPPMRADQSSPAGAAYDPTLAPPGRTLAAYADRREYPAQRSYPAPPDPVTSIGPGRLNVWWSDDPEVAYLAATLPRYTDPSVLNQVATSADPLLTPAPTARRVPATHADRRVYPQQRTSPAAPDPVTAVGTGQLNVWWSDDPEPNFIAATTPRRSDPNLLAPAGAPYDPTTAPQSPARVAPATHAPRPQPPAQRRLTAAVDAVASVGTGALGAWWSVDDWAHFGPAQRRPQADQSSQPVSTPFDPTTAGYGWVAEMVAATHRDRQTAPQQPRLFAAPDQIQVVGTGSLVAWWGVDDTAAYLGQRRGFDLPQQAPAVPFDPTLAAWLPLWLAWSRAATHGDRRLVPQQRPYISDPSTYPVPPPVPAPLVGAGAGGGDTWRRYNTPAYYDRREVPQQPQREWLYFDAGPGVPPLTLAWGAGGAYWHLYNRPSRPRPFWPLSPQFAVMGECDCTTARPFAGTTTRPSSGVTGRPSSGITVRPCTC
jgi:hypothetical protein